MRKSCERLWPAFRALDEAYEIFLKLHQNYAIANELEECAENSHDPAWTERKLVARWCYLYRLLRALHKKLSAAPSPFAHETNVQTVVEYLPRIPDRDKPVDLHIALFDVLYRFEILYFRIPGRLVQTAEQMEKAIGLKPLPVPEDIESFELLMEDVFTKWSGVSSITKEKFKDLSA